MHPLVSAYSNPNTPEKKTEGRIKVFAQLIAPVCPSPERNMIRATAWIDQQIDGDCISYVNCNFTEWTPCRITRSLFSRRALCCVRCTVHIMFRFWNAMNNSILPQNYGKDCSFVLFFMWIFYWLILPANNIVHNVDIKRLFYILKSHR